MGRLTQQTFLQLLPHKCYFPEVPTCLDHGHQYLEMESDQGVQYLGHSGSGGARQDEQGGGALPARGPSGVALGGRAASGPLADPSGTHWSSNDRDLGLYPGSATY